MRAVERALDVLLCFAGAGHEGLGVTQLAQATGLYKSNVHRVLATLEAKGMVRQDPATGRYHLGLRALELAGSYLSASDLASVAYDEMVHLRDAVDETVTLYVRDGLERVRVQKAEGRAGLRRVVGLGQRLPLYLGASGKVLLAFLPAPEREQILEQLPLPPDFDRGAFVSRLGAIVEAGYAASSEEREEGVASVAAPIFRRGQLAAALAISGPSQRFAPEAAQRFAGHVMETARSISLRL